MTSVAVKCGASGVSGCCVIQPKQVTIYLFIYLVQYGQGYRNGSLRIQPPLIAPGPDGRFARETPIGAGSGERRLYSQATATAKANYCGPGIYGMYAQRPDHNTGNYVPYSLRTVDEIKYLQCCLAGRHCRI